LKFNVAIAKAIQLNALILQQIAEQNILDIFTPVNLNTRIIVSKWLEQYTEIQLDKINKGLLKPNTWRTRKNIISKINNIHGKIELAKVTIKKLKSF
tara:strand:- start:1058 stop:1348 length:291 start_codon:yes stop_codon:yes gene_type:complete